MLTTCCVAHFGFRKLIGHWTVSNKGTKVICIYSTNALLTL